MILNWVVGTDENKNTTYGAKSESGIVHIITPVVYDNQIVYQVFGRKFTNVQSAMDCCQLQEDSQFPPLTDTDIVDFVTFMSEGGYLGTKNSCFKDKHETKTFTTRKDIVEFIMKNWPQYRELLKRRRSSQPN